MAGKWETEAFRERKAGRDNLLKRIEERASTTLR